MNTGIHIGHRLDKSSAAIKEIAISIQKILEVGFKTRAEQETIRQALGSLTVALQLSHVSVSNTHVGDRGVDE